MVSFQVTLTTLNTNYNLLTLVRAIDSAFADVGAIVIQADDDGGAQAYRIGDSALSDTRYGQIMHAGDFSAHLPDLAGAYVRCDASGKKMNVACVR